MIRQATTTSPLLRISVSGAPYMPAGATGQGVGMVRYNTNTQGLECFDGMAWTNISQTLHVDIDSELQEMVEWARRKRKEEQELHELMSRHPALKDLHNKLEMMKVLVREERP